MSLYVTLLLTPLDFCLNFAFGILSADSVDRRKMSIGTNEVMARKLTEELVDAYSSLSKQITKNSLTFVRSFEQNLLGAKYKLNATEVYKNFVDEVNENRLDMISKGLSTDLYDRSWRYG